MSNVITLEFIRPGPPHNQLLSPLTGYLALCGDAEAAVVHVPFEHAELQDQLANLRYTQVPEATRAAEVNRLGRDVGGILAQVPGFGVELPPPDVSGRMIHLRLVLGGDELAMIPFELAELPAGLPGASLRLLLQPWLPVCLTRETRGSVRRTARWDREPRVLFVTNDDEHMPPALIEAHEAALAEALRPWGTDGDGAPRLTTLRAATVDQIRAACAERSYTHVHILAHGAQLPAPHDRRFGVRLRDPVDSAAPDVVSGQRLADVLRTPSVDLASTSDPVMVTLASCDSGNVGDAGRRGASVAHELHRNGIPWVIASQFPLWMDASTRFTRVFYRHVLAGRDPRWALHAVRHELFGRYPDRHDWASLVAYAAFTPGFERELDAFASRAFDARVRLAYARADELLDSPDPRFVTSAGDAAPVIAALRDLLEEHGSRPLPTGSLTEERAARAAHHGLRGSLWKRIAELEFASRTEERDVAWRASLAQSARAYQRAVEQGGGDHWVLTQHVVTSLAVSKGTRRPRKPPEPTLTLAWASAQQARASGDRAERMWALASLLELAVCDPRPDAAEPPEAIYEAFADLAATDFPLLSVLRQFRRYVHWWKLGNSVARHLLERMEEEWKNRP